MKVLLVQDKPALSTALKLTLLKKGFDLILSNADTPPDFTINAINPSVIISDITFGRGINYVEAAKEKNVPVIVISEYGEEDVLQMAFDKGADDYVSLPLSIYEIALRVSLLTRPKFSAVA